MAMSSSKQRAQVGYPSRAGIVGSVDLINHQPYFDD